MEGRHAKEVVVVVVGAEVKTGVGINSANNVTSIMSKDPALRRLLLDTKMVP